MSTNWNKPISWEEVGSLPKVDPAGLSDWVYRDEVAVIISKRDDVLELAKKLGFINPTILEQDNILTSSFHVKDDTGRELYGSWWKTLISEKKYVHLMVEFEHKIVR